QRSAIGFLSSGPNDRWQPTSKTHFELRSAAAVQRSHGVFAFTDHHGVLQPEQWDSLQSYVDSVRLQLERFTAKAFTGTVSVQLYRSSEEMALMAGAAAPGHIQQADRAVHEVVNAEYAGRETGGLQGVILRKLLGKPQHPALETGLAIYHTSHWEAQGYRYWAAHLAQSDNVLSLEALLDPQRFEAESPLFTRCFSAALVEFLIAQWGHEQFLARYATWQPDAAAIEALEPAWKAFLVQLANTAPATHRANATRKGLLKGFNFAHEGYRIYNGYNSRMATASLQRLADIGSNAIAIVPYTGQRDPAAPQDYYLAQSPGQENDQGVIHVNYEARQRGMATMLKPQVWVRNGWPGSVAMATDQDWDRFFEAYYRWMRHYALLAEMRDMDMLCVGVEFVNATLEQPERWRQLIRQLRGIYGGAMVYAANWGKEFEQLTFWDELDYLGINCYYPLGTDSNATVAELRVQCENVLDGIQAVAEQHNKPVLFTEIGFRSVNHSWLKPWEEAWGQPVNLDAQHKAYQAMIESLQDETWMAGIFWWKWPANLDYGRHNQRSFTPKEKPAEKLVENWFRNTP
ncbi:MAG: hypothetical protein AAGB22_08865, partial [Bacteroidota bacterium]